MLENAMRADRLLSILLLLQTRDRMTARELSDTLNVSERTIYRDLDALNAAGIPVYTERGPGGGCALVEGYRTNLTGLTEAEVRSLFVPGVPGPLADLGLGQVLEEALLKLLVALPSMHRHDAERVRQRFMLDAAGWFQPEEPVPHLHTLQEAVWQDRKMTMVYRRGDGTQTERTVEPYGLVAKASIWYMVAAVEEQIRVYRVSRVQAATLCEERFERPLTFDLAAYWADWCAEFESSRARLPVTLRAAPELVPILPQIRRRDARHHRRCRSPRRGGLDHTLHDVRIPGDRRPVYVGLWSVGRSPGPACPARAHNRDGSADRGFLHRAVVRSRAGTAFHRWERIKAL
jgi:predicted DNA-binding transcriptional regulator YafY